MFSNLLACVSFLSFGFTPQLLDGICSDSITPFLLNIVLFGCLSTSTYLCPPQLLNHKLPNFFFLFLFFKKNIVLFCD